MKQGKYITGKRRLFNMRCIVSLVLGLSLLSSCDDDGLDIPDIPLSGMVGGQEWTYQYGNNTQYSITTAGSKYTLRLLSTVETSDNPCGVLASTNPYLQVVIPLTRGSYSLPILPNEENLKFVLGNGVELSAASGFIEILAVDLQNQFRVAGYIQAIYSKIKMAWSDIFIL